MSIDDYKNNRIRQQEKNKANAVVIGSALGIDSKEIMHYAIMLNVVILGDINIAFSIIREKMESGKSWEEIKKYITEQTSYVTEDEWKEVFYNA